MKYQRTIDGPFCPDYGSVYRFGACVVVGRGYQNIDKLVSSGVKSLLTPDQACTIIQRKQSRRQ